MSSCLGSQGEARRSVPTKTELKLAKQLVNHLSATAAPAVSSAPAVQAPSRPKPPPPKRKLPQAPNPLSCKKKKVSHPPAPAPSTAPSTSTAPAKPSAPGASPAAHAAPSKPTTAVVPVLGSRESHGGTHEFSDAAPSANKKAKTRRGRRKLSQKALGLL